MDTAPTLDRDDAMLARLAEMDLALAEKLHAAAMAAEEPAEVAGLARAYQKAARSLRQSIALKHRIRRDVAQASRSAPSPEEAGRVEQRAKIVRKAVTRVIFAEAEGEAADWLCDMLEDSIDLRVRRSAGLNASTLDESVIEICDDLALPEETAERWRDLPDPEPRPTSPVAAATAGEEPPAEERVVEGAGLRLSG